MRNISPSLQQVLLGEFRYIAKKMRESRSPDEQLYLFSATYGVLNRIFNIEFDPELVYAHGILQAAYNQINGRLLQMRQGIEPVVSLPGNLFEKLTTAVDDLTDRWERGEAIDAALRQIALLSYVCTGNGYYLYMKGQLTI